MKKKPTPAASKLDSAWSEFFDSQKLDEPVKLHAEGWRSSEDIAKALKMTHNAARSLCARETESGKFEQSNFRVRREKGIREVTFYRPKL